MNGTISGYLGSTFALAEMYDSGIKYFAVCQALLLP